MNVSIVVGLVHRIRYNTVPFVMLILHVTVGIVHFILCFLLIRSVFVFPR